MSWKMSRISSSLMSLLREPEPTAEGHSLTQLERIRQALLDCMAFFLEPHGARPKVWDRVLQAQDIQSLWFLRSDVMHMLSDRCGESIARSRLQVVTEMFQGHVPRAQFASSRRRY